MRVSLPDARVYLNKGPVYPQRDSLCSGKLKRFRTLMKPLTACGGSSAEGAKVTATETLPPGGTTPNAGEAVKYQEGCVCSENGWLFSTDLQRKRPRIRCA
jgi:hypothetical protein